MTRFDERDAARLLPEQAAALLEILNHSARWDALLGEKSTDPQALYARQKANDVVEVARREYAEKFRTTRIPEPTQAKPNRVAVWCRILRVLLRKAEGVNPADVVAQAYRFADRIAAKGGKEPVKDRPTDNILALDGIIAWCNALVTATPLFKPKSKAA